MSEQNPHPRVDVLEKLLQVFTLEQLAIVAERLQSTQAHGWGKVRIVFDNFRAVLIEHEESEKLPR